MNKIVIPDLPTLLANVGTKRLGDDSVATECLVLEATTGGTAKQGSIKAVFGAGLATSVHLFNGEGDADPDGIFGKPPKDKAAAKPTLDWRPQLAHADGHAWLKYSLVADATAGATAKIGGAGGGVNGDRALHLLCYKRHDAAGSIAGGIAADLDALASPLSVADVLGLSVQEATALKVRGKLTANLTVNWADIFSTSLHALTELLGDRSEAFVFDVSSKAGARFKVTVDDDFLLCFTRQRAAGPGAFRVAVRKSVTHDRRARLAAETKVEFADPAAVEAVLSGAMAGLLAVAEEAVEAIEAATSLKQVPEKYRPAALMLAERFGIEDGDPVKPLREKFDALRSTLAGDIEKMARTKVGLGFQYEYLRVAGNASLLEMTLSEQALRRLHGPLLALDFARVLADRGEGVALDFFLHEKTTDRVRAWGFSLGAGTWFNAGSEQERQDRFVDRRYVSPDGEGTTRAYLGSSRYTASANAWSADYGASLKADLEEARPAGSTSGRDFKCGLQLWWSESRIKPATELGRIVDDAVLWGVVDASASQDLTDRLEQRLRGVGHCAPRLSLLLSDHGIRQASREIAGTSDADWTRHAARALPWIGKRPDRASCLSRESIYGPFFDAYATAPGLRGRSLELLVQRCLEPYDPQLARREPTLNASVARFLQSNSGAGGSIWDPCRKFRSGAARLAELLDGRRDWGDFDDAFGQMRAMFESTYAIRMVASFLAARMPTLLHGDRACSATLTVEFLDAGKPRSIVVGGKTT